MKYDIKSFTYENKEFYSVEVNLPKTNLLVVGNDNGYFMCGALDVGIFDSKPHLQERKVVCGRALGVKTIDDLFNGTLEEVSLEALNRGINKGMAIKDALLIIS